MPAARPAMLLLLLVVLVFGASGSSLRRHGGPQPGLSDPLPTIKPPVLYWASNPNHENDTVMLAGAGLHGVISNVSVNGALCKADRWEQAVKFPMVACGEAGKAPCVVKVCNTPFDAPPNPTLQATRAPAQAQCFEHNVNAPDVTVFFPQAGHVDVPPGQGPPLLPSTVASGQTVKAMGRGLVWDQALKTCISAREPLVQPGNTHLALTAVGDSPALGDSSNVPSSGGARRPPAVGNGPTLTVPASVGTCFDVDFALPRSVFAELGGQGRGPVRVEARVQTPWGSSASHLMFIQPPPEEPMNKVLDVDHDFAGDIAMAIKTAAARSQELKPNERFEVRLSARKYAVTEAMDLPPNTPLTVVGAGAEQTRLIVHIPVEHPGVVIPSYVFGGSVRNVVLANFSVIVYEMPQLMPVVSLMANSSMVSLRNLQFEMRQANVSNAVRVNLTENFEIDNCVFLQLGECQGDMTGFIWESSTVLQMFQSTIGAITNNNIQWVCSGYDFDSCDTLVFAGNVFNNTVPVARYGNSLSEYGGTHYSSRQLLVARNHFERPSNQNHSNWMYRETITSDSPGGSFLGYAASVGSSGPNTITLNNTIPPTNVHGVLAVVFGPGLGQTRIIQQVGEDNRTLTLDAPLDPHYDIRYSMLAVMPALGELLVVGNTLVWAEVVQIFGAAPLSSVFADNSFQDCNVARPTTGEITATLGVSGLCYGGMQPVLYSEILRNHMERSNGISFDDRSGYDRGTCFNYVGPYIRWGVARGNYVGGIALSSVNGTCGYIQAGSNWSTDIIIENNQVQCPANGVMPYDNGIRADCNHCVARYT